MQLNWTSLVEKNLELCIETITWEQQPQSNQFEEGRDVNLHKEDDDWTLQIILTRQHSCEDRTNSPVSNYQNAH